jgi:hypothetical protein
VQEQNTDLLFVISPLKGYANVVGSLDLDEGSEEQEESQAVEKTACTEEEVDASKDCCHCTSFKRCGQTNRSPGRRKSTIHGAKQNFLHSRVDDPDNLTPPSLDLLQVLIAAQSQGDFRVCQNLLDDLLHARLATDCESIHPRTPNCWCASKGSVAMARGRTYAGRPVHLEPSL